METQQNLRISIPKPCHEDWNKFTPDEKGAFCKVCSKSVHDFTKKTVEEISTILIDEMSAGKKVCGRFNEDQLEPATPALKGEMQDEMRIDTYSLNFQRLKKFALALFVVFGGFLFGSVKSSAQKMGKIAYVPKPQPIKGELVARDPEPVKRDTAISYADTITPLPKVTNCSKPNMLKGDVAVEPIEPLQIMGGVAAVREPDPIVGQVTVMPTVKIDTVISVVVEDSVIEESLIMGLIAMPEDPSPSLPQGESEGDSTLVSEVVVPESTFVETIEPVENKVLPFGQAQLATEGHLGGAIQCYPNPSSGLINLKYNLKENVLTSIALYDMRGELVKTLVAPQNMYAADYSTQFDISDLSDGIYFCTMKCGDRTSTQRVILSR